MNAYAARCVMHRATVGVHVRSINEQTRECEFVASTESPVETWGGREVLRMAGCKLDRYRANPVFLDAHDGSTIDNVLGSASDVRVEGRELITRMRFAEGGKGDRAWDLVRQGHVKAVSVGYRINPDKVRRLRAGETDEGTEGPCSVVGEWELYEVSLVPVPADEHALAREAPEAEPVAHTTETVTTTASAEQPSECPAPAPAVTKEGRMAAEKPETPAAEVGAPAPAALAEVTLRARLFAICPKGLESKAEECLLRGLSFEESRKALLVEFEARNKPLGTPEPAQQATNPGLSAISDEVFARSLKSALSGR